MPVVLRPSIDVHITAEDLHEELENDVRAGLTSDQKWLPPVWFYDDRGSELFDEITKLPEYYLTRTERQLLIAHASDIARRVRAHTLVELGAGTCAKARVLLDAMCAEGRVSRYVPLDVSIGTLWSAATGVAHDYPGVAVRAVAGDFRRHLGSLPSDGRRLVAFLGSTIGNLRPHERGRFLGELRSILHDGEGLLLGVDLVKDRDRLLAAYNDESGITAEFNRNVLNVLNRELDGGFDLARFDHMGIWNESASWIEMRLRSNEEQVVPIAELSMEVRFRAEEDLLTEISAKFTRDTISAELNSAGFEVDGTWESPGGEFLLALGTA